MYSARGSPLLLLLTLCAVVIVDGLSFCRVTSDCLLPKHQMNRIPVDPPY
jgi:hypothetical protein